MIGKKYYIILAVMFGFFALACSTTQSSFKYDSNEEISEYKIGKSDVLEVSVWKEEELTRTVTVRQDGMISLPLIGDIRADGKTTTELRQDIEERMKKYISQPTITVIVESQESKKYYVVGEVEEPGEYDLIKDITVLQAISYAGGFTEWADKSNIVLIRKNNGQERRMRVNYHRIVSGKSPEQNSVLMANDTVVVQ